MDTNTFNEDQTEHVESSVQVENFTDYDKEISFDTSSGISEEEQSVILGEIDAIAMKNRLHPTKDDLAVKAKKRGTLFPVLVNVCSAVLLAGALVAIYFVSQRNASDFQNSAVFSESASRSLIQSIRRETGAIIDAKDQEIAEISARLEEIDNQLREFQRYMEMRLQQREAELRAQIEREIEAERRRLTELNLSEQAAAEQLRLFVAQREAWMNDQLASFRRQMEAQRVDLEVQLRSLSEQLAVLQRERARLLEEARIREENLQAQLIERTNQLTVSQEQSRTDLTTAHDALFRLNSELERSNLIERELSGFYERVGRHIQSGNLDEAMAVLVSMRNFINTPAFQQLGIMQSRRDFYLASADLLSGMINEALERRNAVPVSASVPAEPVVSVQVDTAAVNSLNTDIANLRERNRVLEQSLSERDQSLATLQQQQNQLIANLNANNSASSVADDLINTLRTQNATLQQTVADQNNTLNTLRTQNTTLQQTVSDQNSTLNTLRSQNTSLQQNVSERDNTINALRTQNTSLQQTVSAHENSINEFRTQNASLQQNAVTQTSTINSLRAQTTSLQQTVTDLRAQTSSLQQSVATQEAAVNDLRSQTTRLQQTVTTHESTISALQTQNATLTQTNEQLRQTNEAVRRLLEN